MNRRATVLGTDTAGNLVLHLADSHLGTAPVPRPIVGSSLTGLHTAPPVGAQVLLLHEGEHMLPKPAAAVTAGDTLSTTLPTLAAGESALYGPDGSILSWAKAGTAQKILYQSPDASFVVSVDPVAKRLNVTGGTVWVGGIQVTVP